jgi:hypothetical protein
MLLLFFIIVISIISIAYIQIKNRVCFLPNTFINKCTDSKGVPKTDEDGDPLYPHCNAYFGEYSCESIKKVCGDLKCADYSQEPRCDFVTRVGYCCNVDYGQCSVDQDCCNGKCQSNVCTGSGPEYQCVKDGGKCDSSPLGCCNTCNSNNICEPAPSGEKWVRKDNSICVSGSSQLTPTPIPPFKISDTTFVPESVKTVEDFGEYVKKYCKHPDCDAFMVNEYPPDEHGVFAGDWKYGISLRCDTDSGSPEISPMKDGKNYVYIRQDD